MTKSKIRAQLQGGDTTVKVLILHPMETGNRKDPLTGFKLARHFIKEVSCERNGKTVMSVQWSWAVSENPYMSFQLKGGQRGDIIKIHWLDNKGAKDTLETAVR